MKCACRKDNDFTELIVLYKLVAGISDVELQEEFLTEAELRLESAERLAVAKESAMSGEDVPHLKSTYNGVQRECCREDLLILWRVQEACG